jgi:hypothetical protein
MRLHDAISSIKDPLCVVMPCGSMHHLPGVNTIATDVCATPIRYVLDDAVAVTVAQAAFGDTAQIARCLDLARIPALSLWVEWSEGGRQRVMQQYGLSNPIDTRQHGGRAGLLVRADESGRRGFVDVAWDGETGRPDLSPVRLSFDLDDPAFAEVPADDPFLRGLRIEGNEPLCKLFSHVRFSINETWRAFYRSACKTDGELAEAVRQNILVVAADFPYLVGFCLLLSARNALEQVPVEMKRLNASRLKRGKDPLLDHIEVKAMLHRAGGDVRGETRATRAHSRLHFVSGHLVRRGSGVFWRRAHVRGNPQRGIISSRTVVVHAGAAMH